MGGHLDVVHLVRPIDEIIRDPAGNPALKQQLQEVLTIREFATRELDLPDNGSYRSYVDIGRPFGL